MANQGEAGEPQGWKTTHVYIMAVACLAIGVVLGYLFRGSATQKSQPAPATASSGSAASAPQMPSLEDMKRMADKKAEPLLARLKTDPNNATLLNEVGTIYKATHQFKEAAEYYQKALDHDPKNVGARTDLATCLYYEGDADTALKELQQSLTYDPNDANTLFNLGIIRWQAKKDSSGAVAAWQRLLKSNPALPQDKKDSVQKLIAEVQSHTLQSN